MGWVKDKKAEELGRQAAEAYADPAKQVFAALLNSPASHSGISSEIGDWSQMVTAIEAEGWQLTHWTASLDTKGRPQAYPLFRRTNAGQAGGAQVWGH
ncbi:hypothetical protein HPO96_37250 [Kribbella sandramycini]|uniref:Uncharacterized protein n=1 Tax=Kribbella sandramycini TaxID=60450 RepID=A0A7Y4L7Q0_9ACTN|nr:hypothetical protein [Kribbella sandramycini]MBB6564452.1 hypothetical protein [Kribbella sandramycini]NOL45908.1 hypothetical protein [Kribbella sandramycini]